MNVSWRPSEVSREELLEFSGKLGGSRFESGARLHRAFQSCMG